MWLTSSPSFIEFPSNLCWPVAQLLLLSLISFFYPSPTELPGYPLFAPSCGQELTELNQPCSPLLHHSITVAFFHTFPPRKHGIFVPRPSPPAAFLRERVPFAPAASSTASLPPARNSLGQSGPYPKRTVPHPILIK